MVGFINLFYWVYSKYLLQSKAKKAHSTARKVILIWTVLGIYIVSFN